MSISSPPRNSERHPTEAHGNSGAGGELWVMSGRFLDRKEDFPHTDIAPEQGFKRKVIFQVPPHKCHGNVGGRRKGCCSPVKQLFSAPRGCDSLQGSCQTN